VNVLSHVNTGTVTGLKTRSLAKQQNTIAENFAPVGEWVVLLLMPVWH